MQVVFCLAPRKQKEKQSGSASAVAACLLFGFFQRIVRIASELADLARGEICADAWKSYGYIFRHCLLWELAPLPSRAWVQVACTNRPRTPRSGAENLPTEG